MSSIFGKYVDEEDLRFTFEMFSDEILAKIKKDLEVQTKQAIEIIDDILASRKKGK